MDARLKQELGGEADPRAKRTGGADKRSRGADDRDTVEDRVWTDEERLQMFRSNHYNDILPDLPPIPGYHVCWLSTTHQGDTIARRIRLGYEPVTEQDVRGMDYARIKDGEHAGFIGVNEMLAFKIPNHLYLMYMQHAHHDEPNAQVEQVASLVDQLKEQALRAGGTLDEEEGVAEMRRAPPRGKFAL